MPRKRQYFTISQAHTTAGLLKFSSKCSKLLEARLWHLKAIRRASKILLNNFSGSRIAVRKYFFCQIMKTKSLSKLSWHGRWVLIFQLSAAMRVEQSLPKTELG